MTAQTATVTDSINVSSSVVIRLVPAPVEVFGVLKPDEAYDPSWSVDGTSIIFAEHIRATYKISTLNVGATQVKDTLLTTTKRLADPSYSADGYFVLFSEQTVPESDDFPYGIWRLRYMNADGTVVVTILDDGNANLHPCWVTPTQIAFQWWSYGATPSDVFQIAMIDLAGNGRIEMGEGEYPRLVSV